MEILRFLHAMQFKGKGGVFVEVRKGLAVASIKRVVAGFCLICAYNLESKCKDGRLHIRFRYVRDMMDICTKIKVLLLGVPG